MRPAVELRSTSDPIFVRPRYVWYWVEIKGVLRSPQSRDYRFVRQCAEALCQEHELRLVDRVAEDSRRRSTFES
jgi:hypothetical protein